MFKNENIFYKEFGNKQLSGDFLLEIEHLKKQSNYHTEILNENIKEKENLMLEITRLEEELTNTIEAYTKVISEFKNTGNICNESLIDISFIGKKDELGKKFESDIENKLKEKDSEIQNLNEKMKKLNDEIEVVKYFNKSDDSKIYNEDKLNRTYFISYLKSYKIITIIKRNSNF